MSDLIDITVPLRLGMPCWPGSMGLETTQVMALSAGDVANVSTLAMDVHCGTHLDAPLHALPSGDPMGSIGLDVLVGTAQVVTIDGIAAIGPAELEQAVPAGTRRLLLKTRNSTVGLQDGPFDEDFSALSPAGAQWVVDHGIKLIGIDYMSIQRFADDQTTHQILLGAPVAILEGLRLQAVKPGAYELLCLPLALPHLEAAPARAVLRPRKDD